MMIWYCPRVQMSTCYDKVQNGCLVDNNHHLQIMKYSHHLVIFLVLVLTGKAYAAFNIFGTYNDSSSESEPEPESDFDYLADDVHPPAAGFKDFWKLGKNIWSYFNSTDNEEKGIDVDADVAKNSAALVENAPIPDPLVVSSAPAADVELDVTDIYEKLHRNTENGKERLETYKIPGIQDLNPVKITGTNANSANKPYALKTNPFQRAERRKMEQQDPNSVTQFPFLKPTHPLAVYSGAFLLKAQISDLEKARARLRPIPKASSPSYENIINFLYASYMGDFDFSLVHDDVGLKSSSMRESGRSGNVLPSFLGDVWLKTDWNTIKNSDNELHTQIKAELCQAAPKTMTALPSLAPKKIRERDVLEGWLIDGLLAAYPTLQNDLSKADAIALILLAVFSNDAFKAPENVETVKQIFADLQKYDGTYLGTFPFDQFNLEAHDKERLTRTLFQVIEDQKLNFSSHVVKEILNRS